MTFKRTKVGFDRRGRSLYEYRLEGTPYLVVRMYPDRGRDGWSIYNEETDIHEWDAWTLADAKALAERAYQSYLETN